MSDTAAIVEQVQAWLAANPEPTDAQLAEAGWVAPQWPGPWGPGATVEQAGAIEAELLAAGIRLPDNSIGIGWAGPTILAAGSDAQKERFLPRILSNEDHWCQLFSEPESGSDLASLRTTAVRDGDEWVVNGQKVWTTDADTSAWGILLARTDPDAPPHKGISYFLCPMDTAGIEVRPIREMSGGSHFCEVFFTDARIPGDALLGGEGEGWRLATLTLGNERVTLSHGGLLWGMGPTGEEVLDAAIALARSGVRSDGAPNAMADPRLRQQFARLYTDAFILDRLAEKVRAVAEREGRPGPEASLEKLLSDQHGQRLYELLFDLGGPASMLAGGDSTWPGAVSEIAPEPLGAGLGARHQNPWPWGALFSRALTIGGGTTQVQRNIIAERLLGLPREPR
ncbi:MAG: acyl-CoA dehydrogenase [Actinomycetia bacterium]|nr:acyl-CoA dehydrogenase [Actinomycetes bacterium]